MLLNNINSINTDTVNQICNSINPSLTGFFSLVASAAGPCEGSQKLGSCFAFPSTMLDTLEDATKD